MSQIKENTSSFKREPYLLKELVRRKAAGSGGEAFDGFIEHRYWRPFAHSIRWSFWYSWAFTGLTLIVIAGGVTSSVLAALPGQRADLAIAILGVLVAVTASVNRLWRPGTRAALRHRTANELRREGWSFVCRQGRYRETGAQSVGVFFEEVERINMPAESIDEQEMEAEAKG